MIATLYLKLWMSSRGSLRGIMAWNLQAEMQSPQSTQRFGSMRALRSRTRIASVGQTRTQALEGVVILCLFTLHFL